MSVWSPLSAPSQGLDTGGRGGMGRDGTGQGWDGGVQNGCGECRCGKLVGTEDREGKMGVKGV